MKKGGINQEASFAAADARLCKEEETVNGTVEANVDCLELQETGGAKTWNDNKFEDKEEKTSQIETPESIQNKLEIKMENCVQEAPETQGVVHESNEMDQCLEQQENSYLNEWEDQEEYEDETCKTLYNFNNIYYIYFRNVYTYYDNRNINTCLCAQHYILIIYAG